MYKINRLNMNQVNKNEKCFMLSYSIYLLFSLLSTTFYFSYYNGTIYRLIKLVYLMILFAGEIENIKTQKKDAICGALIFGILYLYVAYYTGILSDAAIMFFFLYCGRNIPFEKIAKRTILIATFVLIFVIGSSQIGIITNYIEESYTDTFELRHREYLGFRYALFPAAIMFDITALVLYLRKVSVRWYDVAVLTVGNYWIFSKTNSRLSFYMAIIVIAGAVIIKYVPCILEKAAIVQLGMIFSYIIATVASFLMTILYNSDVSWMNTIDRILVNRLEYGKRSLLLYGVHLFGNKNIEWVGNGLDEFGNITKMEGQEYLWVDNFYISVSQKYGILLFLFVIVSLTIALFFAFKQKNYYLTFFLAVIAGRCIVDDLFLYLHYNTFWLAVSMLLFERSNYENWKIWHAVEKIAGVKKNC